MHSMSREPGAHRLRQKSPRRGRTVLTSVASLAVALGGMVLASPVASAANSHGTLDIAAFLPFSGTNASYGPLGLSGCYPAVYDIDKAGGVLGHKLACTSVDDRGDPVDAVPAADGLVAHDGNVVAVFGPSSTTALATTPTLFRAHLPTFLMAGKPQYDHVTNPYEWRFTPPDAAEGWAEAAWAHQRKYTRAAAVFSTTSTSIGGATSAIAGFKKLGGKIVTSIKLTPGQPSYSTEAEKLATSHAQVIFFTSPFGTSATFLAELKQLMPALPPLYVVEVEEEPQWLNAVEGAIGTSFLSKDVAFETAVATTSTPGWKTFDKAITSDPQKVSDVSQYLHTSFTLSYYDAANLVALAMVKTGSTKPSRFNSAILGLTEPGGGKTIVHTFAAGEKALKAGKSIEYIGADGQLDVNKFHNVAGKFYALTQGAKPKRIGAVTQKLIDKAAL